MTIEIEQSYGLWSLVTDKTGTLTLGKPQLTAVAANQGFDEDEILRLGGQP